MSLRVSDIQVDNPRPAGQAFRLEYTVGNDGDAIQPPHVGRVQIWGSDNVVVVDEQVSIGEIQAGEHAVGAVDVPPLEPGHYDVSVTLPDPHSAGSLGDTIIVEGTSGGGGAAAGEGAADSEGRGAGAGESTGDETQEPTLRHGDESIDGWVEYLRQLLAVWQQITGVDPISSGESFDDETLEAVIWFQRGRRLLVDGVVGNQTWAALRTEDPQPIGTDGREPGTFVEMGVEARWMVDDSSARHHRESDSIALWAFNTGSEPLDAQTFVATVHVTTSDGEQHVIEQATFGVDEGESAMPGEQFSWYFSAADYPDGETSVRAEMAESLGGDILESTVPLSRDDGGGGGGSEVDTPLVHFVDRTEVGFTPMPKVGEEVEVWWTEINDGSAHEGSYVTEIRWVDHEDEPVGDSEFLEFEYDSLESGLPTERRESIAAPREDRMGHTIEVYLDRTTYGDGDGNYSEGHNKSYHNVNPTE